MNQPTLRLVHGSDLHLERPLHGLAEIPDHLRERLIEAPYHAAEQMFETALAEDVDALVLAGSTSEPTGRRARSFRALALAYDRTHHQVFDRLTAAFIRRRYPGGLGDLLVTSGFAYRGGSEALRSLAGEPFLPRLAAYPGTVVLVNGGRDLAMRPGERRFLARARRGRLVTLPGAYHLSSLDRPAEFTAVIRSAVEEVVEARRASP